MVQGTSGKNTGWAQASLFPVILAIFVIWTLCLVSSLTGLIGEGHPAYISLSGVFSAAPIRTNNYFFPWGTPKFDAAFFIIFIVAYLVSTIESIGDYNAVNEIATESLSDLEPKTVNSGILTEGIGCAISTIFGGLPTTSYSENVGLIGITGVASRLVVLVAGVILILGGILPTIGQLLATIPGPVMGGLYCVLFGMISGIGLRYAAKADLGNMRNVTIMGFALFFGFAVPSAFTSNEAKEALKLFFGNGLYDVVIGIASSNMAVTALVGLLLDNVVPKK